MEWDLISKLVEHGGAQGILLLWIFMLYRERNVERNERRRMVEQLLERALHISRGHANEDL